VGRGTKERESSTGRIWVPGFHHFTARSRLAGVLKLMNRSFLKFFNVLFQAAVNRGYCISGYGGTAVYQDETGTVASV
jgi:hypothetical protein